MTEPDRKPVTCDGVLIGHIWPAHGGWNATILDNLGPDFWCLTPEAAAGTLREVFVNRTPEERA